MRVALRVSVVRYLAVGVLSFAVDFGVLVLLRSGLALPLPLATTLAYLAAFGVNFGLNRSWTFGAGRQAAGGQLVRYLLLVGLNLVLTVVIVSTLGSGRIDYRWAKVVATAVVTVVNFTLLRAWVFRDRRGGSVAA